MTIFLFQYCELMDDTNQFYINQNWTILEKNSSTGQTGTFQDLGPEAYFIYVSETFNKIWESI